MALFAVEHLAYALFHLPGGFVGKGHRGDSARAHPALLDQISNFGGNHTGFARTSARQHQAGAIDITHRFLLARV